MYITVGPSLCFGFNFRNNNDKEEKVKLNDVINSIKNDVFDNAIEIHKDKINLDTINGMINEILNYYEIEHFSDELNSVVIDAIGTVAYTMIFKAAFKMSNVNVGKFDINDIFKLFVPVTFASLTIDYLEKQKYIPIDI